MTTMTAPNQYQGAALPNTPETAKSLIACYLDGETMQDLACLHGVTRPRLYQILLGQAPEEWRDAQVSHAIDRLEQAKERIDAAENALMLAQAREGAKIAQFELERLFKRFYGPSAELTGKDGAPITVEVVRYGRTIEGETGVDMGVSTLTLPNK